jgi:hypothetical protein
MQAAGGSGYGGGEGRGRWLIHLNLLASQPQDLKVERLHESGSGGVELHSNGFAGIEGSCQMGHDFRLDLSSSSSVGKCAHMSFYRWLIEIFLASLFKFRLCWFKSEQNLLCHCKDIRLNYSYVFNFSK